MQNVLIVINLLLFTLIMTKHTVRQNRRGFFSTHRFSLHDILQSSQKKTESRRLVVGHGLTTFSATNFLYDSLLFKVTARPPPPYDSTSALHDRTTCQKPTATLGHAHNSFMQFGRVVFQTREQTDRQTSRHTDTAGTSAGFWLGGQCPLATRGKENFENLTTKWCILKYI